MSEKWETIPVVFHKTQDGVATGESISSSYPASYPVPVVGDYIFLDFEHNPNAKFTVNQRWLAFDKQRDELIPTRVEIYIEAVKP